MTFDESVDFCKHNPKIVATILMKTIQLEEDLMKANKVHSSKKIKRQSFDLPEIKIMVTQFEQYTKICPRCSAVNTKAFLTNLTTATQYGDNLRSFIAYCNAYQMIPCDRISELDRRFHFT